MSKLPGLTINNIQNNGRTIVVFTIKVEKNDIRYMINERLCGHILLMAVQCNVQSPSIQSREGASVFDPNVIAY